MSKNAAQWTTPPKFPASHYVDSRIYSEQQIFEEEREKLFKPAWIIACHESELAAAFDYRLFTHPAGVPLIVIRGDDQKVRALTIRKEHRSNGISVDFAADFYLPARSPKLRGIERDADQAGEIRIFGALAVELDVLLVEPVLRNALALGPHDDGTPGVDDQLAVLPSADPALARLVAHPSPPDVAHSNSHVEQSLGGVSRYALTRPRRRGTSCTSSPSRRGTGRCGRPSAPRGGPSR